MSQPLELPPYPYDRLRAFAAAAGRVEGGMVDCSVGTPCDAPPAAALAALATSGTERGYPPAAGSDELRRAAATWLTRRFGAEVDPAQVAPCVGTKELVASVAHLLRLRRPERDVVLYPAVSYPTYAVGALLAGCRPVPVTTTAGGTLDLASVAEEAAERALLVWVNAPANPTGQLADLEAVAAWGRSRQVPVLSDECYAEFTWEGPPRSVVQHGSAGVLAVHSLSKRSNLAGLRVGFYAGDAELVDYLREIRRHAGLMVPGPVQAAAVAALGDDAHVEHQRALYRERLELMAAALGKVGLPVELPAGGFYLWTGLPEGQGDAWAVAERLAADAGLLVSPGDLYGPDGAGHLRVAVVQPTERLALAAERLAARGPLA